jgi:FKBP-type peptidyl-prolyl cis-trans isomerase
MRRRRAAALVITSLLAAAVTAGCASSSSSTQAAAGSTASASSSASSPASSGASSAADDYTSVTATGAFGKAPTVTIPAAAGSGTLYTKTVIQGTGPKLTSTQSLLGNFVLYDWSGKTHKLIGSTYTDKVPTLFTGSLLPGLETALEGQKVGSRVLAVIPPADAFGSAGKGPTITIPSAAAPKTLQVKTLIKGTGAVVKKGQYLVVQYTGVNYRTKKVFDSSWSRSEPFATVIGEGQVIPGWDTGLVGQTVGSRVLLVIPPKEGYGTAGSSAAGIKGTDTLVFAVDIISAS